MLNYAKILSKDFRFVRVDFLYNKKSFYFAEMTFTPQSGYFHIPNAEFDNLLGSWITID